MVNDNYVNCKDCVNQDDYVWYIVECTGVECPDAILDADRALYTLSSNNPQPDNDMVDLMLELTDEEDTGVFTLYRVEIDPKTGRRNYTRIASVKDGVEI